jgi:hypothetical protein
VRSKCHETPLKELQSICKAASRDGSSNETEDTAAAMNALSLCFGRISARSGVRDVFEEFPFRVVAPAPACKRFEETALGAGALVHCRGDIRNRGSQREKDC